MKIVFASANDNKINEIRQMLPNDIEILGLHDIGCYDEIPETASTIEGNAILKADYISSKFGFNCFADDTGLEIPALNNEPGVFSARYAGEAKSADANMDKVLQKLSQNLNRIAHFKTVIALNLDGKQHLFTGIANGSITLEKSGDGGFGYDPIFIPDSYNQTFAQLSTSEKAIVSHRGKAVRELVAFLKK